MNKKDYKKLSPFKGWVIQNFPYIEEDFDAITDYQLYCKIVEYLNDVIYNQNLLDEANNEMVDAINSFISYVNNYLENLDVYEEIDKKINAMVENGTFENIVGNYLSPYITTLTNTVNAKLEEQDSQIALINNKVNAAVDNSPIPVASTSDMTDTTRIYVNTTNGYWYYYDGDSWEQGGVYQSTGIGDNTITTAMIQNKSITPEKLDLNFSRSDQLFNKNDYNTVAKIWNENTGVFTDSANSRSLYIPVTAGQTYYVTKTLGSRFALCTTSVIPTSSEVVALNTSGNNSPTTNTKLSITAPENANYLCVFFYNVGADSGLTQSEIADTIMINTGSDYKDYQDYYEIVTDGNYIKDNSISQDKLSFENADLSKLINNNDIIKNIKAIPYISNTYNVTTKVFTKNYNNDFRTVVLPVTEKGTIRITKNITINTTCQMYLLDNDYKVVAQFYEPTIFTYTEFPQLINYGSKFKFKVYQNYIDFDNEYNYKQGAKYLWFTFNTTQFYNNSIKYLNTSNPSLLDYLETNYSCVNMFDNIASVGDSFTEGSIYDSNGQWVRYDNISYIATIGNRAGINWYNYGKGGTTTKTYQDSQEFSKLLSDNPRKLYLISFGINDANQEMSIGTIDDIHDSDYTLNADSFYGNYGKLIQKIINHAFNSKIVLINTMREGTTYTDYREAIKVIAEHYSIPCIEPFEDSFFRSSFFTNYQSSNHPTAMTYAGMGLAIDRLFNKCVFNNPDYFKFSNE